MPRARRAKQAMSRGRDELRREGLQAKKHAARAFGERSPFQPGPAETRAMPNARGCGVKGLIEARRRRQ